MHVNDLQTAFAQAGKRTHFIGSAIAGVLIALDLEGRLFTVWNGEVVNRVNLDAVRYHSDQDTYHNPGGDVLWPAPEGSMMGYQYATGKWRVAPGIRFARYQVKETMGNSALVEAEIDLVNNMGVGLPTIFSRHIYVAGKEDRMVVNVKESITYIGKDVLHVSDVKLAPWTLCQFDTDRGGKVVFPCTDKSELWDLYNDPVADQYILSENMMEVMVDGGKRFQLGLSASVPWIEFHHLQQGMQVKRTAREIAPDQSYIDISDKDPQYLPGERGVRFSIYNDASNFMEIEAAGGCPEIIRRGTVLSVDVETSYRSR